MSKELEESGANDSVNNDVPTPDNDDDDDDPREAFSITLTPDRILRLTDNSQGSSMIASGSTLPSMDGDEKAKAQVSNRDGSMNVRKLEPPLRPVNEQSRNQEEQETPTNNGTRVSLTAAQILTLSEEQTASVSTNSNDDVPPRNVKQKKRKAKAAKGVNTKQKAPAATVPGAVNSTNDAQEMPTNRAGVSLTAAQILTLSEEHTASISTNNTPPKNAQKKRKAKAAKGVDTKQPVPSATVPGAFANTNDAGNQKQALSSVPRPNNNRDSATNDLEDPGSSAFMTTPGAYQVEGLGNISSRRAAPSPPPSPRTSHEKKDPSLVMASAIDREALKEELRQELLAEQAGTQVVMAVPTAVEEDATRDSVNTETRQVRSSSRISFANNRKWWILLAVAVLLVGGAVAVALIVAPGGSGGGGKKKDDGKGDGGGGGGGDD